MLADSVRQAGSFDAGVGTGKGRLPLCEQRLRLGLVDRVFRTESQDLGVPRRDRLILIEDGSNQRVRVGRLSSLPRGLALGRLGQLDLPRRDDLLQRGHVLRLDGDPTIAVGAPLLDQDAPGVVVAELLIERPECGSVGKLLSQGMPPSGGSDRRWVVRI